MELIGLVFILKIRNHFGGFENKKSLSITKHAKNTFLSIPLHRPSMANLMPFPIKKNPFLKSRTILNFGLKTLFRGIQYLHFLQYNLAK